MSTTGIVLEVAGQQLGGWTQVAIRRDLRDVAGSFHLTYYDKARIDAALGPQAGPLTYTPLTEGMACRVTYLGQVLLTGWIDDVDILWDATRIEAHISGRDAVGDLVDCAAVPNGPAEFRKLTALQIASQLAAPFNIKVTADVDVGAPFPVFGVNLDETVLMAIERATRQRALLAVSDGVGGLLLTRGGSTRAPGALTDESFLVPQPHADILSRHYHGSWRERFSDYFVKGQTQSAPWRGLTDCTITPGLDPSSTPVAAPGAETTTAEGQAIMMTGHAIDPAVTRWRPTVNGVRTQSGASSVQAQAEWALRVARGMSQQAEYTVLGWDVQGAMWKPNALVAVTDAYLGINKDMLIASVEFQADNHGMTTTLGLAGRTAFDRIDESTGRGRIFRHHRVLGPTRKG